MLSLNWIFKGQLREAPKAWYAFSVAINRRADGEDRNAPEKIKPAKAYLRRVSLV
jgi:hypothetical protein